MRNQCGEAVSGISASFDGRREEREARAFGAELARRRADLFARAAILTQDRAEADDLVQATLERALLARKRFHAGTNLRAWLRSILHHLFIDSCRRAKHLVPLVDEPEFNSVEKTWGPLDVLTINDVLKTIEGLSPGDAEILRLAHVQNLSYRHIAMRLEIPINTAATRLFRARTKLRPVLAEICEHRLLNGDRSADSQRRLQSD